MNISMMRIASRSLSLRLGLMLAAVAAMVFSTTVYLLHKDLERILHLDEEADLSGKVHVVQRFLDEVKTEDDVANLKRHLDAAGLGARSRWNVWMVNRDGQQIYGDTLPTVVETGPQRIRLERTDGVVLLGTTYTLEDNPIFPAARVYIGMDPRPRQLMLAHYDQSSLLICIIGMLISVVLAFAVTRRGLRPIRQLSNEAASIMPDALSRRLSLPHASEELMPIVLRFNEVLGRMEEAWLQLDGFNADVAHELRTPLAVMINGAEVALSRERPSEQLREVLETHLEELRAMGSMVNDMLFLASADGGALAQNVGPVELRLEAIRVIDFVDALLEERRQTVTVEGNAELVASGSLVCRAIVNLLTNAARHADSGAKLVVRITQCDGGASVEVINPGAPIPEDIQRRMFDRFWRGDNARAKSGDRFGLGLAIVRAASRMHGGTTFVRSDAGLNHVGFTLTSQI